MQTRRRGTELEATILEAAWAEVQEHGYARLTIEGVAARARTGKQVLYRRWPNRAQLVLAAVRHTLGPLVPAVPDTGSLREDLLSVLRLMGGRGRQINRELLYGLMAEHADFPADLWSVLPAVIGEILRNAAARGELSGAQLPERVTRLPLDLLRYEGLRRAAGTTVEDEAEMERVYTEIADQVVLPLWRAVDGPVTRVT